jgi:hypothetical protein
VAQNQVNIFWVGIIVLKDVMDINQRRLKMKNKDRIIYDLACDVINIVDNFGYSKEDIREARKNAMKITQELDKKEEREEKSFFFRLFNFFIFWRR